MWIIADVVFDNDETAREAERLARDGLMPGISVDMTDVDFTEEILATDDDGFPTDWLVTVSGAEIVGATQVAMPAFADARIEFGPDGPIAFLVPEALETSDRRIIEAGALRWRDPAPLMFNDTSDGHDGATFVGNLTNFRRALAASAIELDEPVGADPGLSTLTRPRIVGGEITGHGAGWGTCHAAFRDACITAPHSAEYGTMPIYRHPRGDVHAPLHLGADAARAWYDAHCELVSMAAAGEDEVGIWVNGASILDDGEVFLSGDWRSVDGALQLISFLVVENPGFPTALVASDVQNTLTAAGMVTATDPLASLAARIEELERVRAAERILASI